MTWGARSVARGARWGLVALVWLWALVVGLQAPHPALTAVVVTSAAAALLVAPRLPIAALVVVFAAMFAWGSLVDDQGDDPLIAMLVLASYGVGRHAALGRQPWAAAGVLLLLATNLTEDGREVAVADVVFPVLLSAGPWLLGLVVQLSARRERAAVAYADHLTATREEAELRAAAEERLRIARELHDQVAHTISAVSLQAQVMRRQVAAGRAVGESELRSIETTAQQAMADLRRLLGILRPAEEGPMEPQPGWEDAERLVAEVRAAGQRVVLRREGEARPVAPVLGTAAYRILQEALTNARRHGRGDTHVVLRQGEGLLEIEVTNPLGPERATGVGHGTTGMRERAELFGGVLESGPRGGSWVVRAVLPAPTREVAR